MGDGDGGGGVDGVNTQEVQEVDDDGANVVEVGGGGDEGTSHGFGDVEGGGGEGAEGGAPELHDETAHDCGAKTSLQNITRSLEKTTNVLRDGDIRTFSFTSSLVKNVEALEGSDEEL